MRSARGLVVVVAAFAVLSSAGACTVDPNNLPELIFDIPVEDTWPSPQLAPPPGPGEGRVLVTNNLDDTVSVVDLDLALSGESGLLGTVPVGFVPVEREGPHHIVADANGEFYYLGISNFVPGSGSGPHGVHGSGTAAGHIMKLRVDDNSLVASVRIDRNPGDVRLTPDGRLLLASHFDLLKIAEAGDVVEGPAVNSRLAIVDAATMTRVGDLVDACPAAHGIGITSDSSTAVMSCVSDEVAVVDLESRVVTRVPVLDEPGTAQQPDCFPYAITMDATRVDAGSSTLGTAWASCFNNGGVIAVDVDTHARDGREIQLQGAALFGEVRDGTFVIAHQSITGGVDGITLFDVSGAEPIFRSTKLTSPDECLLPHVAKFSEDGGKILVVCEGDKSNPGTLLVLDAVAPHATISVTPLGIFPDDIALLRRAP